ncbi:ribonuclease HI [bacterium]|jgi:ribonuclease HI|nr:ribonuclease HI [bacterium]
MEAESAAHESTRVGEFEVPTRSEVLKRYTGGPQTGVFTDGGASPNPGPGGWGLVHVVNGEILHEEHGYEQDTTNNRMELTALIHALKLVSPEEEITVYSDSDLCVKTINEWAAGWEARGWKRKSGPIKNLELVQELYALKQERPGVTLQWIKAHDGSRWNEYADALATAWMREE